MLKIIAVPLAVFAIVGGPVSAATPHMLHEEARARAEERLIVARPIAGIENRLWFDYRTNISETRKELASDLRRATDTEDLRDAWDEYRSELAHERRHYVREMTERGHRYGIVTVE